MGDSTNSRIGNVLVVAAALAVFAGAIEVVVAAYKQIVLGRITFLSYDFVWMKPASYLILVVPGALLAYGLSIVIRRPLALSTVTGLIAAALLFSMLLPYGAIVWWASALLAAGAGMRIMTWTAGASSDLWVKRLRVVATVVAAALLTGGIAVRAERVMTERKALTALPAPPTGPNVLLIVLDTVRASSMGLYGYDRPTTPRLEQVARESTVFDRAMVTAPWTLPSHASMFTGLDAEATGVGWDTPLPQSRRTLAEVLRDRGYLTGGFVANFWYTSHESGFPRGFARYSSYETSLETLLSHSSLLRVDIVSKLPEARSFKTAWTELLSSHVTAKWNVPATVFKSSGAVVDGFLDWQAGAGERPFFAFLNLFDAHGPYRAPEAQLRQFATGGRERQVDRYDASIAWLDQVVADLLATLKSRGVLDNTIVVITSDHGEQFGEHGISGHANSLYLDLLHVPLIIRYPPAVPASRRVGTLVSLRDLPATILDLAGLSGSLPGTSLSSTWSMPETAIHTTVTAHVDKEWDVGPEFLNSAGAMFSVFDERLHYIRDGNGGEELYDYRKDPKELKNLAALPEFQADLLRLRQRVDRK